jgi:hypothetical protein
MKPKNEIPKDRTGGRLELDRKLLAPCGMNCGFCLGYKREKTPYCPGCFAHKGQPYWGECKLYACATKHKVEHCGLCEDFPCDFFVGYFTGAPDNLRGQRDTIFRVGLLTYRKKTSTEKYLEMVKKLKGYIEKF